MLCSYKEKIALWEWYDADILSSTNDEIKNLIQNKEHIALSAKEQTKGRGRRGRIWHSDKGNLYFSYTINFKPEKISQIVCLIGLSLAKTLLNHTQNKLVQIKWPNDVFIEHKKVSGILIENIKDDLWIIGIGVNITSYPELNNSNYQATSLEENDIPISRKDLLKEYLEVFYKEYQEYQNIGFTKIKQNWLKLALNYKKEITIKTEKEIKTGTFLTLDDNGYLILKTNKGEEKIIAGDLFI